MAREHAAAAPSIAIFSPHAEAKAAEALNVLIFAHGGGEDPIREDHLRDARTSLTGLVDCLFPFDGDCADFDGADSLDGIDYIHPTRVAALSIVIGRTMGMRRSELISLAMAAALMNVGYLALRRSLLDQPRRLLGAEWEEHLHTHPQRGIAILAQSGLSEESLAAIGQHHERWDGSGYPEGLRGEDISLHARILAVADSYISLRSIRPHRPPIEGNRALAQIAGDSGKLYEPSVIDAFEDVIARFTGIARPRPVASATAVDLTTRDNERIQSRHDGAAITEDGVGDDQRPTGDTGAAEEALPAPRPRTKRRAITDDPTRAASDRRQVGATPRPSVGSVPPPPPQSSRPVQPARSAEAAPPARSRATARRRSGHRPTLFTPMLYVDAAISGRWGLRGLNR